MPADAGRAGPRSRPPRAQKGQNPPGARATPRSNCSSSRASSAPPSSRSPTPARSRPGPSSATSPPRKTCCSPTRRRSSTSSSPPSTARPVDEPPLRSLKFAALTVVARYEDQREWLKAALGDRRRYAHVAGARLRTAGHLERRCGPVARAASPRFFAIDRAAARNPPRGCGVERGVARRDANVGRRSQDQDRHARRSRVRAARRGIRQLVRRGRAASRRPRIRPRTSRARPRRQAGHARHRHPRRVHRRARQHGAERRHPDDPARLPHHAADPRSG